MSKELAATITVGVLILGFLWNISERIIALESRITALDAKISVLQSEVEANSKTIAESRADLREIRSIVNSHLELHARQALAPVGSKAER